MKNMLSKFLLSLIIAISLTGCAALNDTIAGDPWRAYAGVRLSGDKVALIKTSGMRSYTSETYIFLINDITVEKIGGYIEVLPGHYVLEAHVAQRLGGPGSLLGALSEKRAQGSIVLEAEAGRIYVVDGRVVDGQAILWIEDEKTEQVVAGNKP